MSARHGRLQATTLTVSEGRDGETLYVVELLAKWDRAQIQRLAKTLLEAEANVRLLQQLLEDLSTVLAEAVAERGGGAGGLIAAQAAFPELYERQQAIRAALLRSGASS